MALKRYRTNGSYVNFGGNFVIYNICNKVPSQDSYFIVGVKGNYDTLP